MLGPFILALHDNPRGKMGESDGGIGFIDVLSAAPVER